MKQAEPSAPPLAYANPAPTAYANPGPTSSANPAPIAYANPAPIAYANPAVAIISPHFCSPHPVDIAIVRKVLTITDGNFVVTDINDKIIFKVKGVRWSRHDRRVLLDTAGYPIVTLRKKVIRIS